VRLMLALSITRDHAWTSPEVMALLAAAAVLLIVFFILELRTDHPIVPFGLFKDSTFSVSMIVGFLSGFAMFGSIVFVPLIYQGVLGVTATNSGQLLTPMMLGLIVASTLTGQVLGAALAQQLPNYVRDQVATLHLPAQAARFLPSGGASPQTLFDPAQIAARRAQASAFGPQGAALFDQVLHAIRIALASTLHEIFLLGAAILILALIASVFLKDVPLRGRLPARAEGAPEAA